MSSTSITYSAPSKIKVNEDVTIEIASDDAILLQLVNVSADLKNKRLGAYITSRIFPAKLSTFKVEESRAVYWLKVRPEIFSLQTMDGKVVDEEGFEYKTFDVFVVADKQIVFSPSSVVILIGKVVPNPRSQTLSLLASSVEFPEELDSFDVTKLSRLKAKMDSLVGVEERLNWILSNFEIYSQIINRRNVALGCLLVHFTPLYVKLNGDVVRGWGNGLVQGDSTTGKSATEQKLERLLQGGAYITAETASQVGLVGSAVQKEQGGWYVDWGFLPLQDRKLLAIDGSHKLSMSNWGSLAESERSGVVTIAKAAKEQTWARTRQIKIANALDRDTWQTKNLRDFLYDAQAVASILDKISIARLDFAVFASTQEVKPDDVNKEHAGKYDEDLELLSEAQKWAWSSKVNIVYEDSALKLILSEATGLYKMFHVDAIPLVSIDMKYKLGRLAAALALLTLSTENFETVTVKKEHVERVVTFLSEEYRRAGLNVLAQLEKNETLEEAEIDGIIFEMCKLLDQDMVKGEDGVPLAYPKVVSIFKHLVVAGRTTKAELKQTFDLPEKNVLLPLVAYLQEQGLVRGGKGYYATSKVIQLWRARFATLATIATVKKGGGVDQKDKPNQGGFFFEDSKDGKRGKILGSDLIFTRIEKREGLYLTCKEHPEGYFLAPTEWNAHVGSMHKA